MEWLRRFNTVINKGLCIAMVICFICMVILIFAQVFCRYVLNDALSWSEELAGYFFHWATFLGASVAFYDNSHISVTYFIDRITNTRLRAFIMTLADCCCLWFLGMYVVDGFYVCRMVFKFGETAASMTWLPMGFVQLAIPLASVFMVLNILYYLIGHLRALFTGVPNQTESAV